MKKLYLFPASLFILIMVVIPVIILIISAVPNLSEVLSQSFVISALLLTLKVCLATVLITHLIGVPLGIYLSLSASSLKRILIYVMLFSTLISGVVKTISWVSLLSDNGLINNIYMFITNSSEPLKILYTPNAIVIGLVYIFLPLVTVNTFVATNKVNREQISAAHTLGSSKLDVLLSIIFPQILFDILVSVLIIFTTSISIYSVPKILGGQEKVLATLLQEYLSKYNLEYTSAISLILIVISFISVLLINLLQNIHLYKEFLPGIKSHIPEFVSNATKKILVAITYIFVFFPLIFLVLVSFTKSSVFKIDGFSIQWYVEVFTSKTFLNTLADSLLISLCGVSIMLVLALIFSYGLYKYSDLKKFSFITDVPLIIPNIVLSFLLYIILIVKFDVTSFLALILAHAVITLPYATKSLISAFSKFDPNIELAARTLGMGNITTIFKIIIPNISASILSICLISFINSFNNLAISLFLTDSKVNVLPKLIIEEVENNYEPTVAALSVVLIVCTILITLFIEKVLKFSLVD